MLEVEDLDCRLDWQSFVLRGVAARFLREFLAVDRFAQAVALRFLDVRMNLPEQSSAFGQILKILSLSDMNAAYASNANSNHAEECCYLEEDIDSSIKPVGDDPRVIGHYLH